MMRPCWKCQAANDAAAKFCSICGAPLTAQPAPVALTQGSVPNSGKAVAALVCGICGFFSCGLLGLVGVILGLVAQAEIRRAGGRIGGYGLAVAGLTTGACSLLLVPMFVAIAIPGFIKARDQSQAVSCMEAQDKLEEAIDQWAQEHDKEDGDTPTYADLIGARGYLIRTPVCPTTGAPIEIAPVGEACECPQSRPDHTRD